MHLGEEEFEYLTLSLNSISENNIVIIVIVALAVRLDFDSSYVQRERDVSDGYTLQKYASQRRI